MKTNTASETLSNQKTLVLKKVIVNQALNPFRKHESQSNLSIHGYKLRQWLEHLNSSEGIYFLDMGAFRNSYSLHFKHHGSGKLMELDCPLEVKDDESGTKECLEALLFDLSLFENAPILAYDTDMVEDELRKLSAIFYEQRKAIETVIGRLVNLDMKKLFATGIYYEPKIKQLTIDGIYRAFFPGTSRSFKEQGSYAMYLIYLAIQNIFYQVLGKSIIA